MSAISKRPVFALLLNKKVYYIEKDKNNEDEDQKSEKRAANGRMCLR